MNHKLPLEIQTCDGYFLQLTCDQQSYICSGLLEFLATDLIFAECPDHSWLCYKDGVDFHVTIPNVDPEDEAEFMANRLPGQIEIDDCPYWLNDEQLTYEGYDGFIPVHHVRNNLESCTLPDARTFKILTWIPGLSPVECLLKK
jgi:hypothetical protein